MQKNNLQDDHYQDQIDLKKLSRILLRSWKLLVLVTFASALLALIYTNQKESRYESSVFLEMGSYETPPSLKNPQGISLIEPVSNLIKDEIKKEVDNIISKGHRPPHLAAVLVGEDGASLTYVGSKVRSCQRVGFNSTLIKLSDDILESKLLDKIQELNENDDIDGFIVQLPLPKHINEEKVLLAIDPNKDVDGFHISNVGMLATGQKSMVPCTPLGCLMMLRDHHGSLSGLNAVVVGRSNIVGKPMANLLLRDSCTVTIAHSRTKNIESICRNADIVIAAVGRPEMITGDWIGDGATVIDVGINRIPHPEKEGKFKLVGDVHFESVSAKAGAITPVPGGVGPMTIACLLANTLTATCRANNLPEPEGLTV